MTEFREEAIDLYAGAGGWDVAAHNLGLDPLGFENNDLACETRDAVGYRTVKGDLSLVDPRDYPSRGQIASPPCQGFTLLGKGNGRRDSVALLAALKDVITVEDLETVMEELSLTMTDSRSLHVLQPLRWALYVKPEWVAWEQVIAVAPIWAACSEILEKNGYSTAHGVLNSEQYGVPQTRRRAVLVGSRVKDVELPPATHSKYYNVNPDKLDAGLPSWLSMSDALKTGPSGVKVNNQSGSFYNLEEQISTPATAVAGRALVGFRGANANRFNGSTKSRNDGWVCTQEQAALLQSFPADFPFQGTMAARFQQIGNAIPPGLAQAILAVVI